MKEPFNTTKLITDVYEALEEKFTLKEVEELLNLGEEAYHKDSPHSVGKSLFIVSLEFSGLKRLGNIEKAIQYERTFKKGVNMWVGDNLVGKSSIFKIVKLALTGRNSISKEVSGWITEIGLTFRIGTNKYTSELHTEITNRQRKSSD
jgi:hypothetical protein